MLEMESYQPEPVSEEQDWHSHKEAGRGKGWVGDDCGGGGEGGGGAWVSKIKKGKPKKLHKK